MFRTPVAALLLLVLAGPALAEDDAPKMKVTYRKGVRFTTADDEYELKLAFRTQLRFESLRPTEDGAQFENRFMIVRARFGAEGHAFGDDTRYKLEVALGDQGGFGFLKDIFIDQRLPGTEDTWLRAGLWRRPFSRQEMVSDFGNELNERAITTTFVGGGRDLGVGLHNQHETSPAGLEWVVGVFNQFAGGSDRPTIATTCSTDAAGALACKTPVPTNTPTDFSPAVVTRVAWNHGDIKGYTEADLDGGPLRFSVGAAYKLDLANFTDGTESSYANNLSHAAEVDALIKVHGFGLHVEVDALKRKSADPELGFLFQPGYFVLPKHLQLAARFAVVTAGSREHLETRLALNYYFHGHAYKLATDAGLLLLTGRDPSTNLKDKPDLQFRTMLQLTL